MVTMIWTLFKIFFKIGLFTFGGGYGMISLVKDECVDKQKWLEDKEFVDIIAIAESTPGPIAVNMATYIGYKKKGLLGSIFATIGVVLPSLIIIYVIAVYLHNFLSIKVVSDAFFGIRIAVALIIIRTSYNLIKSEYKNSSNKKFTLALFVIYTFVLLYVDIKSIHISSVAFIILAFVIGIILLLFNNGKLNDIS